MEDSTGSIESSVEIKSWLKIIKKSSPAINKKQTPRIERNRGKIRVNWRVAGTHMANFIKTGQFTIQILNH